MYLSRNGGDRSGLLCVVSVVLERLKVEQDVAITHVIKVLRSCRKLYISTLGLSKKWLGPYQVIKKVDDLIYVIKTGLSKLPNAVHVDRLLPYNGSKKSRWMTN